MEEVASEADVGVSLTVRNHNTRGRHAENEEAENLQEIIQSLHDYMQRKIGEEFEARFNNSNIELLQCFAAFDAGKRDTYLDFNLLKSLVEKFPFLNIENAFLEMEIARARRDFSEGVPFSRMRCLNITKLMCLKNTVATSTASVERVFSGMNRTCTKLRSKLTPEHLGDFLTISMNRDISNKLDVEELVELWSNAGPHRIFVN